jgi:hypothetical protein
LVRNEPENQENGIADLAPVPVQCADIPSVQKESGPQNRHPLQSTSAVPRMDLDNRSAINTRDEPADSLTYALILLLSDVVSHVRLWQCERPSRPGKHAPVKWKTSLQSARPATAVW